MTARRICPACQGFGWRVVAAICRVIETGPLQLKWLQGSPVIVPCGSCDPDHRGSPS